MNYELPIYYYSYLRTMAVVETIANFSALWLIIKVSPESSGSYRWHLAWYQASATIMESFLHILHPEFFFPTPSGRITGVCAFIGAQLALCIGACLVATMIISTFQCFFYRYQLLLPHESPLRFTNKTFYILLVSHYLFCNLSILIVMAALPLEYGPTSAAVKLIVEQFPNYTFLEDLPDVYGSYSAPIYPPMIMVSSWFIGFSVYFAWVAYLGITWSLIYLHSIYLLHQELSYMSKKTKAMHAKYIKVLLVTILIPFIFIGFPLFGFGFITVFDLETPMAIINLLSAIFGSHTTISSLTLIFYTAAYRKWVLEHVKKSLKITVHQNPRVFSLVVNSVQTNRSYNRSNRSIN